jgi:hypothetical protein
MEVEIRGNIPIDQCLPVSGRSNNADQGPGGGAPNLDQLGLEAKYGLIDARTSERCANGDPVRGQIVRQGREGVRGRNEQSRSSTRVGNRLHCRRHGISYAGAAVDQDLDPVQGLGDEQRLSRSSHEDDTGSTGDGGLGALRRQDDLDDAIGDEWRPNQPRDGQRNSAAGV